MEKIVIPLSRSSQSKLTANGGSRSPSATRNCCRKNHTPPLTQPKQRPKNSCKPGHPICPRAQAKILLSYTDARSRSTPTKVGALCRIVPNLLSKQEQ